MKKILFCLIAAMFLAACEKDTPEQPVVPEPEPEQPKVEMFERRVIKLPAELPDNVEQLLIDAPCWHRSSIYYIAYVANHDITIYDQSDPGDVGGPVKNTYKFFDNNELVYYWTSMGSAYPDTSTKNYDWSKYNIVEYTDSTVLFTHSDLRTVGTVAVYSLHLGSQEHIDEMISNITTYWKSWLYYNKLSQEEITKVLRSKPCWSGVRYKGKYVKDKASIINETDYYENDNREQTFVFDESNYDYYYFPAKSNDFESGYYERHSWKKANIISSTEDEVIAILDPEVRYIPGRAVDIYILKPSTQEHLDLMKAKCEMKK